MNRSKFGVSVSFALLATVAILSYVPQGQSREIGENAGLRAPPRAGVPRHVRRNRRANRSQGREAKLRAWASGRC